jgi:hypothetical protein
VWHVSCKSCNAYDIVGAGHPATTYNPETDQHVITDRSAFRHAHADDCQPGEDGNYPLHFDFMAGVGPAGAS